MRRTIVIVPEWLATNPDASVLRQSLPALTLATELGEIIRLNPIPDSETPEALWLGMPPNMVNLRQGPLTVAALGADPPERSTHFHLSIMGLVDGVVTPIGTELPEELSRLAIETARRLETNLLTIVEGSGVDHGLVWESVGDLGDTPARDAAGKPIRECLPEGDGETILRRFIDDSVNLLQSLPANEQRQDEGLVPVNLLWPWGHGVRTPVPNLALRRGEPALVLSGSSRLAGLTRLAGYRHGDLRAFGHGIRTRLDDIAKRCLGEDVAVVFVDAFVELREKRMMVEAEWVSREISDRLLDPLLQNLLKSPASLTLLAPVSGALGLGLRVQTGSRLETVFPFDERSVEERAIPMGDVNVEVERGLS